MRLGIVSTSLSGDVGEAFHEATKIGAEGVEVTFLTAGTAKALHDDGLANQLRQLADETGVTVSSIGLGCLCEAPTLIGTPSEITAAQRIVEQAIALAGATGAPVVQLPFLAKGILETEDLLNRAIDSVIELLDPAEDAGVSLGIESTLNFAQMQYLLTALGDTPIAKICLDTGDSKARKVEVPTGIRELGPGRVAQVHFKDVRVRDGEPPDFALRLGAGDVDFRAVMDSLNAIGYDGWIVLETPPGHDSLDSARANLAFARGLL